MEFKKIVNLDFIILIFVPVISLFNILMGMHYIDSINIKENVLGLLSGFFFILMYAIYKYCIEKKNKILAYESLSVDEKIINIATINSIFGYLFIFISGLVVSKAALLTIGYTHNNMGHLNSAFAPFLLVALIVFIPIPVYFFTNANVYITTKCIRIIWNNSFLGRLFVVKNSIYMHSNICTIKKIGLIFKKIIIKYSNGSEYEINSVVVKNYKELESNLNEIVKNIGDKK